MRKNNFIPLVVVIIGILLMANIFLTHYNNTIIKQNKALQAETTVIRTYYDQIGKLVIHSLDIGLRGYAIMENEQFAAPMSNARLAKDSIFNHVESRLSKLDYDMTELTVLKDSINAYADFIFHLKKLKAEKQHEAFLTLFSTDKGAHLWWQYEQCEKNIDAFIDRINIETQSRYEAAIARNQILQIILFVICFPTLLYTAYYTAKTFKLSELLRHAEEDKNKNLSEQNIRLEHMVHQRTQEMAAQNEEIISQSEELASQRDTLALQNKQLHEAQQIISEQNQEIQSKNAVLELEIKHRTQDLEHANQELIKHNNQLEQFAFIAAHNLRAPLARILGLANIMQISTGEDRALALQKLVASTQDLDNVIKDLNTILDIKKHKSNRTEVNLTQLLERVLTTLEKEREETGAEIIYDFGGGDTLLAVAPYIESILYNMISNAIKYRHPDRAPLITLKTHLEPPFLRLTITDNGLGIDLSKYRNSMFNLYKRFHLHMEGKGLGLYLTKTQLEAMDGRIDVQSEPDRGTTFSIYFRL